MFYLQVPYLQIFGNLCSWRYIRTRKDLANKLTFHQRTTVCIFEFTDLKCIISTVLFKKTMKILVITTSSAFPTSSFEEGLANWNCFPFKLTCLNLWFSTSIIGWIDINHFSQPVLFFSHSLQILAMPVQLFSLCSVSPPQNSVQQSKFWYTKLRTDIKCSTGLTQLCKRAVRPEISISRFNSRNNERRDSWTEWYVKWWSGPSSE